MAIFEINSSNTNIDIQKLKREIESTGAGTVISITTSSVGVKVKIESPTSPGSVITSLINAHTSQKRKRVLVSALPDGNGAASNKEHVENAVTGVLSDVATLIDTRVAALVNSAPVTLDTLGELSSALGSDPNFATTISTRIGLSEAAIAVLQDAPAPTTNLDSLTDVTITTPVSNHGLKYNGSEWINYSMPTVAVSGSYTDLNNKPTVPTDLDSLTDVTITTPVTDHILKYNGSGWVNSVSSTTGATTLDELTDVVIATPLKGHLVVHNGTNFVNSNTIETSGAAIKALIVKGAASQTANLLEIQNSAGTALSLIASSGAIKLPDNNGGSGYAVGFVSDAAMGIYRKAANQMTLTAANQTGLTIDATSGVSRVGIGNTTNAISRIHVYDNGLTTTSGLTLGLTTGTLVQLYRSADNILSLNGAFNILSAGAANKALIVKGATSQTANLLEAQNSAGSSLWSIDSTGSQSSGTVPVARVSGLASVATSGSYTDLSNKPSEFQPGMIMPYAGSVAPTGWLICDSTTTPDRMADAALFAVIGITYGPGNGSSTFNVPDLTRRSPTGKGASDTLGASDGLAYANRLHTHSLTSPAHYHDMSAAGSTLATDITHAHDSSTVTGTVGGSDGTHTHGISLVARSGAGNTSTTDILSSYVAAGSTSYPFTNGSATSTTGSGHGHSHSLAAPGTSVTGATSRVVTGKIGLVTGGVNGDAQMTVGTVSIPHLVVNYIIKR